MSNRDSIVYKLRRKCQVAFSYIAPKELQCKTYSRLVMHKKVDLKNPQTFNEKLQYLKIHDYPTNELVIKCADKYKVRDYVKEKGLGNYLVKLYWQGKDPKQIPWDTLPDKFVLKCNHGCAYNILVKDKSKVDRAAVEKQLQKWLKEDFGRFNCEPQYSKIERRIICEEFIEGDLKDYKFFCFNGEPKFLYVSEGLENDATAKLGFFNIDGSKPNWSRKSHYTEIEKFKKPAFYDEMLKMSKKLAKDFYFVRVDIFVSGNKFYFSELTFTPGGAMMSFDPDSTDLDFGGQLNITKVKIK